MYLESVNPGLDEIDTFDHIAEVSILSSTSYLTIEDDESPEKTFEIKLPSAGEYRIRVCFSGLENESDLYPVNCCKIHIWRAPFNKRKVIKWWSKWVPVSPQKTADGRRTIYGVSAYITALKEKELISLAQREYAPAQKLIPYLPKGYKETAFLMKDKDECLSEYKTEPPHSFPFLRELTLQEAEKLFGY